MKVYIMMILICCPFVTSYAQLASPVIDVSNNGIGAIAKFVAKLSEVIENDILPLKHKVSKVQNFLKKANEKISVVVKNMKMTKDLIQTEQEIEAIFQNSIEQIQNAEDLTEKWRYTFILTGLLHESIRVFEVLEITYDEDKGIMDDEGRIQLIQSLLKNARKVKSSMKAAIRRMNKEIYWIKRSKKEIQLFSNLFDSN